MFAPMKKIFKNDIGPPNASRGGFTRAFEIAAEEHYDRGAERNKENSL